MIGDELLQSFLELTKQESLEEGILKLVNDFIDTKLKYWQLVDENFRKEKGMSFEEYETNCREEWDGIDYSKTEKFHDWEDAIIGLEFYKDLQDKWAFKNIIKK